MFNFFKREKASQPIQIRDTLFGDLPLSEWPRDDGITGEPWGYFIQVKKYLDRKDKAAAISILKKIAETPELEPRHYLQAWHFLRELGVTPPPNAAKIVYGMVVEVGFEKGTDLLAAYMNYTARYINFGGGGVIWERPDSSLDTEIETLLKAGQAVANAIGPWDKPRPPAPKNGNVRLNMLTPSGLHFGEGGFITLSNDPLGKSIIDPATKLMNSLIGKQPRK